MKTYKYKDERIKIKRGYVGIGMFEPKDIDNLGGVIRSAFCFGADFVFTIGNRYHKQPTDTYNATRHMPLWHFTTFEDFSLHLPSAVSIVAIEFMDKAKPLETYRHPKEAVYLLGGEDRTLPIEILENCTTVRKIETRLCLNVASAATCVLYDRQLKFK